MGVGSRLLSFLASRVMAVPMRVKITGLVLAVTFFLGAVAAIELRYDLYTILSAELQARALLNAREIAVRAGDDLATGDLLAVNAALVSAREHNPDMLYAVVLDEDGVPVTSTFPEGVPPDLVRLPAERGPRFSKERAYVLETDAGTVRDIRVPAYDGGDKATVIVGVSDARIEEVIAAATERLTGLTVAAGMIAVGVGLLLANLLTRPLRALMGAMRALSAGDLSARAEMPEDRDIAYLTSSFNHMAERLEAQDAERFEYERRIERRNRELDLLQQLDADRSTGTSSSSYADEVAGVLLDELGCAAVWLVAQHPDGRAVVATRGVSVQSVTSACLDRCHADCVLEEVLIDAGKMRSPCPASDFVAAHDAAAWEEGAYVVTAMIESPEDARGAIVLAIPRAAFDPDLPGVLRAVARQVGLSFDVLWMRGERIAREARLSALLAYTMDAQERERNRVAHELHDDIGQKLTYLKLGLKVLAGRARDASKQIELVSSLQETVSDSIDGVRRAVSSLGPAALDDVGLIPALERLAQDAARGFGFVVDFEADEECGEGLAREQSIAMYRVVQEALTNAGRHSGCERVSVVVRGRAQELEIVVEDDGSGFVVDEAGVAGESGRHIGLSGMQERMQLVGGRLVVESAIGAGTAVHVRMNSAAVRLGRRSRNE